MISNNNLHFDVVFNYLNVLRDSYINFKLLVYFIVLCKFI